MRAGSVGKVRKGRRGPRGKGTLFPKGDGWVGRKIVGRHPVTGRVIYAERAGRTQAEVLEKLAQVGPPTSKTTLGQWATSWLSGLDVSPKTLDSYTLSVRDYIAPSLGHLALTALTAHYIELASKQWLKKTRKGKGGVDVLLSPNTVNLALSHLGTCLQTAVRAGLILANPARSMKRPKSVRKKIDPFSPEELAAIIRLCSPIPRCQILAFLAATGARDGEAIALEVGDYDKQARTVAITKGFRNWKHGVGKTKTPASVRTIRVPDAAVPAIIASIGKRTSRYLFPSTTSAPKNHNALYWPWRWVCKRLGLRPRNVHQLRHSCISHLLAAGVPIADVARFVGNSPAIIFRTYTHPTSVDVAGAMDAVLKGGKPARSRP